MTRIGAPVPPSPAVRVDHEGRVGYRLTVAPAARPYWLVLSQSYNAGWQANAKGLPALGPSTLVNGYANGWLVEPAASRHGEPVHVTLRWTPQRRVWIAIAISLLAMFVAVGVIIVAMRRRRAPAARRDGVAEADWSLAPAGTWPGWAATVASGVAMGGVAWFVAGVWAAPIVGAAVIVSMRWRHARAVVALLPAALIGLVGLYIAADQIRSHPPSIFEWPTLFPHATNLAWLAILLFVGDGVVEYVRTRGRRRPA